MGMCDEGQETEYDGFQLVLDSALKHNHFADTYKPASHGLPGDRDPSFFKHPEAQKYYEPLVSSLVLDKALFTDSTFRVYEFGGNLQRLGNQPVVQKVSHLEVTLDKLSAAPDLKMYYFAVTLRAVAKQHPELIPALFETKRNGFGLHVLDLPINGAASRLVIDDEVPVENDGGFKFLQKANGCTWPILLEKAWAKMHNGYSSTYKSNPMVLLSEMFGMNSDYYALGDVRHKLEGWVKEQNVVLLAVKEGFNPAVMKGVNSKFIFSVVGARKVRLGTAEKLVYMLDCPLRKKLKGSASDEIEALAKEFGLSTAEAICYNFLTAEEVDSNFDFCVVGRRNYRFRRSVPYQTGAEAFYQLKFEKDCLARVTLVQHYKGYTRGNYDYQNVCADLFDRERFLTEGKNLGKKKQSVVFEGHVTAHDLTVRVFMARSKASEAVLVVESGADSRVIEEDYDRGREGFNRVISNEALSESSEFKDESNLRFRLFWLDSKAIFYLKSLSKVDRKATLTLLGCKNLMIVERDGRKVLPSQHRIQLEFSKQSDRTVVLQQNEISKDAQLESYKISTD